MITQQMQMPDKIQVEEAYSNSHCRFVMQPLEHGYANTVTGDNDILEGINPYLLDGQYGNLFDADENNLNLQA